MSLDGQRTIKWLETLPKISIAWIGWTNVTDRQTTDRQTDGRWHIANVNVSSRSLKTSTLAISKIYRNVYQHSRTSTFIVQYRKSYVWVQRFSLIVYHCRQPKQRYVRTCLHHCDVVVTWSTCYCNGSDAATEQHIRLCVCYVKAKEGHFKHRLIQ